MVKLGGLSYDLDLHHTTTLSDIKLEILRRSGYTPWRQQLLLGETILSDPSATLKEIGITDASTLTLVIVREPIGQSSLKTFDGTKTISSSQGKPLRNGDALKECLNEYEFMSFQAASKAEAEFGMDIGWDDTEITFLGAWELDLYWTTRTNGCRYEYWSTAPGDNEYGMLVRIDADTMVGIGKGSDDGLELFQDEAVQKLLEDDGDILQELFEEGWPRFQRDKESDQEDESEDEDAKMEF